MVRTLDRSWRLLAAGVIAAALLAFAAGHARAASYPAGGSGFNGGPEGWSVPTPATCNVPIGGLCSAFAGYDGANGNPPGSLTVDTNIALNVLGLLKSNGTFLSPDFVAKEGGSATLGLERQIASSSLVDLTPSATYTATLIDRTSGVSSTVLSDAVTSADTAFAGKDGAVKVVEGHTYAIQIAAETSSNIASLALLGGSTSLRFDNVALTVGTTGGGGGGGGGGGSGGGGGAGGNTGTLTNSQLATLIRQNGLVGNAVLKGNRIVVKAKCPAKVGRACRVTVQGLVKKGKPATNRRLGNIPKGKTRKFVLRVKPKQRAKLKGKQRLLFKQTVKAGKAKVTVYKRLKLIKRG